MNSRLVRIRPFLGSADFAQSRDFYRCLGFDELPLSPTMVAFNAQSVWFYLQDYYVQDWVDNTMVFLEVSELDDFHEAVQAMELPERFPGAKLSAITENDWGREFFLHDPAGNLWHIGTFAQ